MASLGGDEGTEGLVAMQELKVIGVENGALLAASDDGARFRIEIDEVLQSRIRQAQPETHTGPKPSPREVQALHPLRACRPRTSRRSPARRVDYVRRFEGPVLAEREHVVTSALGRARARHGRGRPGRRAADLRQRHPRPPGQARRARRALGELEGRGARLDRQARVHGRHHRPRRPLGLRAAQAVAAPHELRGDHALAAGRAQGRPHPPPARRRARDADESRFDSGAFTFDEPDHGDFDTAPHLEPLPYARTTPATSSPAAARAAIKRADEPTPSLSETADLLEALRRRRGEREAAVVAEPEQPQLPLVPAPVAETPQPRPRCEELDRGEAGHGGPRALGRQDRDRTRELVARLQEGSRVDAQLGRDRLRRPHRRRPRLTTRPRSTVIARRLRRDAASAPSIMRSV